MRPRNNSNAENELNQYNRYLSDKHSLQKVLSDKTNVNVEIGMGKGEYIMQVAHLNPDKIYIGVELSKTVLALAVKKIKRYEKENNIQLDNLYIMSFDAIKISEYFNVKQIDIIYLNFSDPWPKSKHEKRRLTYKTFLEEYLKTLKENGKIRIKTDNRKLFEYTLKSMNNFGFNFEEVYLDLHKTQVDNIQTEYERKFCDKGPIYMLVCNMKKRR